MSRYCGAIGFAETYESTPGVWENHIVERGNYYGDVIRNRHKNENGESRNDNVNIDNLFSIVADDYAYDHFGSMRYILWMNQKWKITSVEVKRPRLILTVGGIWNGQTA